MTELPKKKRGLGSPNMDPATKHRIHSLGGKAQPREAKAKGGRIGGRISRKPAVTKGGDT